MKRIAGIIAVPALAAAGVLLMLALGWVCLVLDLCGVNGSGWVDVFGDID